MKPPRGLGRRHTREPEQKGPRHHRIPQWTIRNWEFRKGKVYLGTRTNQQWKIGRHGTRRVFAARDENTVFHNLNKTLVSYEIEELLAMLEKQMKNIWTAIQDMVTARPGIRRLNMERATVRLIRDHIILQEIRSGNLAEEMKQRYLALPDLTEQWALKQKEWEKKAPALTEDTWKRIVYQNDRTTNLFSFFDPDNHHLKTIERTTQAIVGIVPPRAVKLLLGGNGVINTNGHIIDGGQQWLPISPEFAYGIVPKDATEPCDDHQLPITNLTTDWTFALNQATVNQNKEIIGTSEEHIRSFTDDLRSERYGRHPNDQG